jgi:acyl-CoA reductase-like NAD-dependent aldehyde dehydrogenase
MSEPRVWQNRSPGDLEIILDEIAGSDVAAAVAAAREAFPGWARTPLEARTAALREAQAGIRAEAEALARLIALETGKALTEARGELGAVIAKFDVAIADAEQFIADQPVTDGPHPALIRHKPRGPAAVVAPFNFPIHLGHGAAVAYLLAGNPVLFKPSPLAAVTGAAYGSIMTRALPPGVFQIVQGWGETGRALCVHPDVRAVCFTGSIPVGRALARELAEDYAKSLALELGGKNATLVCADADLAQAAADIAQATCLTAGQRCNATSLAFVHADVLDGFSSRLVADLAIYRPGDPLREETKMGALVSAAAVERYRTLTALDAGEWILRQPVPERVEGRRGHYVEPAVVVCDDFVRLAASPLHREESFCPILAVIPFRDDAEALRMHDATPFGLTTSIYTRDQERFEQLGAELNVGNLYWNLPTTLSPSTLPFGGLGASGNGKPGGRGFIRFAADEQAVQWRKSL